MIMVIMGTGVLITGGSTYLRDTGTRLLYDLLQRTTKLCWMATNLITHLKQYL